MAKLKETIASPGEPIKIRVSDIIQEVLPIPVADIFPSPSNPRRHIDEGKLEELSRSIEKFGVIQAVTVRPKKGMTGKYELVCGERRWSASKLAQRLTIPSSVRELSDDEVLDLQFAENLDREDVHPMDEAVTFEAMIKTGRYTIADIAAKVTKSDAFIAQRLSLNNLIKELQEDFWADKFLIGHAILFSRLPAADQKELHKNNKSGYDTLRETKDYIDRNIIRKLSSAPFKRDDAELVPAAGPCTTCMKRSGCNTSLFADYSDDDRCFDQACFEKKLGAFVIRKVKDTLENKPDIQLIDQRHYGDKLDPAVKKTAEGMGVKILDLNSGDVSSHQRTGWVQVKGLVVSGSDAGKMKTIYIPGTGKKSASKNGKPVKRTALDVDLEIEGIKTRQKRALELDSEKIWGRTKGMLDEAADLTKLDFASEFFTPEERNAIAVALLIKISSSGDYEEQAAKVIGIKGDYFFLELQHVKKLKDVSFSQLSHLLRLFMLSVLKNSGNPDANAGPFMLMPVLKADNYLGEKFTTIEAEQTVEATERIARAEKRMTKLKAEKKELEGKKPAPAKKSAAKKSAKSKGPKPKPADFDNDDPDYVEAPDFNQGDDLDEDDE